MLFPTMQFRLVRVIEIIAVQCETKVFKILKNHFAERTLSFYVKMLEIRKLHEFLLQLVKLKSYRLNVFPNFLIR